MIRDDDVFAEALNLPAAERAAFLGQACAGDAALRNRVAALLTAHEQGRGFLETPLAEPHVVLPEEKPGDQIGRYTLRQKIGEGGCGVVWLAVQGEPLRREVAIKVIKLGMDTKEVIARFDAERQALALMDHPNIAQVFDAGATRTGRPFFAMELVRGVRITDFCDEQNLSIPERLALFIQVCRAIQHAHLKGIVHRDIKPSNILVTLHDGVAVPKVIDFGVAKAMRGRLTANPFYTAFEQRIGTPAYMSPEQMEPAGLDIDTRSDVYSLGVLLYELLAGQPPFDPAKLSQLSSDEMSRVIRDTDPVKPSDRVNAPAQSDRVAVARRRGTEPKQLRKLLGGDLDWIVMRCLHKNRASRYETANELARDVERHLQSEPVVARPPGKLYLFRKLAARHKILTASIATATTVLVLVAGGASVIAWRSSRAARAEIQMSSRTDLAVGSQLLEEGKISEGLAFLVRAARSDPDNHAIGPRLLSALTYRNFILPEGKALMFPHPTLLRDARYSPDGRILSTYSQDGVLRFWDLAESRLLREFRLGTVEQVGDYSPDQQHTAAGGIDGSVWVFDSGTGKVVLPPLVHGSALTAVRYSPDGRWIGSGGLDATAKLWDAATGKLKASLAYGARIRTISFSPDSSRMVVTTAGFQWQIWNVPEGRPVIPVSGTPGIQLSGNSAFSPDGRLVALPDQRGALLYDASTGAQVGPRLDHLRRCRLAVFSRDGASIVTASSDGQAKLWAVPSGKLLVPPLRHGGDVSAAEFIAHDRHLVTLAGDGIVRIWDTATGELAAQPLRGHFQRLTVSPDGSEFTAFGRNDGGVRRWRTHTSAIRPMKLPSSPDRLVVCNGAGDTAWALYPDRVQAFALPSGEATGPARLFPAKVDRSSLVLSPHRPCLFVRLDSGESEFWDLAGREIVRRPCGVVPSRPSLRLFSPDAELFALLHDETVVHVWNTRTGVMVGGALRHAWWPSALEFSPDNRLLAVATSGGKVVLWDLATGKERDPAIQTTTTVDAIAFSPDGKRLATGARNYEVQLWNPRTGRAVGAPLPHLWQISDLHFSRDSRRLLTAGGNEFRVWDVTTGAPLTPAITQPVAPGDYLMKVDFSPDESRIGVFTAEGEVRVYDSSSGQLLVEPIKTGRPIYWRGCGLDASSQYVTVTSATGDFSRWPLPPLLRSPVPAWLLQLATATAGGTIDRFAAFRELAFDERAFDGVRHKLDQLPADAPYAEWGRWFLADPATRPIAPGLKPAPPGAIPAATPAPTTGGS